MYSVSCGTVGVPELIGVTFTCIGMGTLHRHPWSTARLTHTMNIGTRLRIQIVFWEECRSNRYRTFRKTLQLTRQVRRAAPHLSSSCKASTCPRPFQAWVSACRQWCYLGNHQYPSTCVRWDTWTAVSPLRGQWILTLPFPSCASCLLFPHSPSSHKPNTKRRLQASHLY